MSCRRINRWVLRHGVEQIPSRWRDHVSHCRTCQVLLSQVEALDAALSQTDPPDPGEAYWDGFAPRLARRLGAITDRRTQVTAGRTPVWARVWVPAVGVAVLAFLIGRELLIEPVHNTVLDIDVPVAASTAGNDTAASPARISEPDHVSPPVHQLSQENAAPREREKSMARREVSLAQPTEPSRPAEKPPVQNQQSPASPGAVATDDLAESNPSRQPGVAELRKVQPSGGSIDSQSKVWPDRQVTIMGEVDADTPRQTIEDKDKLVEQGTAAFSENGAVFAPGNAESAGALPPQLRLEAARTWRAPATPDSLSPTETMRRFDELVDLRRQIVRLQAVVPDQQTSEQAVRLCAMWYRLGTITDSLQELEEAIVQLNQCIQVVEDSVSGNWQAKSLQLKKRRKLLQR